MALVAGVVLLGLLQVGGWGHAQERGVAATANGPAAPTTGTLDLWIRGRVLGLIPESPTVDNLGLESVSAPTGAGTTRFLEPSTAPGSGPSLRMYVVHPVCLPGRPEGLYRVPIGTVGTLPEGVLRGTPRALPGRPPRSHLAP